MSYQDELQRLEAENARLKDELIDVLRCDIDAIKRRDGTIANLESEIERLNNELSRCKPNLDDAPIWAETLNAEWYWVGNGLSYGAGCFQEEIK